MANMNTTTSLTDLPTKPKVQFDLGNGGYIKSDEDISPIIASTMCNLNRDAEIFHEKLMSLGVKSYRCNDGWVDRADRVMIQRKECDWEIGFYFYGTSDIKEGDLVAIGNVRDGAMVVKAIECRDFDGYSIGIRYSEEVMFVVNGIYEGKVIVSRYKSPYPIYEDDLNSTTEPYIRRLVKICFER